MRPVVVVKNENNMIEVSLEKFEKLIQEVYEEGKKDAKRDLSPTIINYPTISNINDDYMNTCTSCNVNSTSQSNSDSKIIKTNNED